MKRLMGVALLAAAGLLTGCLGSSYRIPSSELRTLAATPPPQRGERVRVIQGFAGSEEPPPAPGVHAETVIIVDGGPHHDHYHGDHHGPGGPGGGPGGPPGAQPGPAPGAQPGAPAAPRTRGASLRAEDKKAWFVAAAVIAVAAAVTEGARYDGWVRLHPMHPVHLYGPYGEHAWVPLAQLDEQTAAWAVRAYVRPNEGPWQAMGRAPLDRQGFTYAVLLGSGAIQGRDDSSSFGFVGHVQLGGFLTQSVGLLFDLGAGWSDATSNGTMAYDSRGGLELDLFLLNAGLFHLGIFGQGGLANRWQDGFVGHDSSFYVGGGALLQLEITTRLALTARAALVQEYDDTVGDFTAGLSIY